MRGEELTGEELTVPGALQVCSPFTVNPDISNAGVGNFKSSVSFCDLRGKISCCSKDWLEYWWEH